MSWCYLLVLTALAAVSTAQISFGGSRGAVGGFGGGGAGGGGGDRGGDRGRPCTNPDGAGGSCQQAGSCPALLQRIRNRDASYLRRAICGQEAGSILLCCAASSRPFNSGFNSGSGSGFNGGSDSGFIGGSSSGFNGGSSIGFNGGSNSGFNGDSNSGFSGGSNSGFSGGSSSGFNGGSNSGFNGGSNSGFNGGSSSGFNGGSSSGFNSGGRRCRRFRSPSTCGQSNFVPERVVNGRDVRALGDFPWMAALQYGGGRDVRCGGSIISQRWVLTAAHCILQNGPVGVLVGDLNLATDTDDSAQFPPQTVDVERTVRHPDYRRSFRRGQTGTLNDIGLVRVARPIRMSPVVKPLCLPERTKTAEAYDGTPVFIAGWGATDFAGIKSSLMQWARINVTSHQRCGSLYQQRGVVVTDRHLCAAGENAAGGIDSCKGDSGGPLMESRTVFNQRKWTATGVVSFGIGCGAPDNPGIYTRVDAYLDWIACAINGN